MSTLAPTLASIASDPHAEAVARVIARLDTLHPEGWAKAPTQVRHCSAEESKVHLMASPEIRASRWFLSPQAFARDRACAAIVPELVGMSAGDALRSIAFLASDPAIRAVGVRRMRKSEGWTRQLIWDAAAVPSAVHAIISGPVDALATECCGGELYRALVALRHADPSVPALDVLRSVDRCPQVRAAACAALAQAAPAPAPVEAAPAETVTEKAEKPAKRMPRKAKKD